MPDWSSIVREHGPMAFQTAWRILGHVQDTEDAVQDALLEAVRTFGAGTIENWGGLLRTAATRRALDRLRKRRGSSPLPTEISTPGHASPERVAEARELADRLRASVAELPARQAEVFSLHYFGEMTNPEIAAALQISVNAVGVSLHKSRMSIAAMLNTENQMRAPQP